MFRYWLFVICFSVVGCKNNTVDAAVASKSRNDKRAATAEILLSKTPVPRTYVIQGNQLQVLDIPVLNNSGFVEMQRCMVWRDAEFKTVSISCPQQAEVILTN